MNKDLDSKVKQINPSVGLLMVTLAVLLSIQAPRASYAEQKFNPFSRKWETVPNNSNWQIKYNPYERDYSYQPPNSQIEFNALENTFEWNYDE